MIRSAGALGVLGGAVFLAAFVVEIPDGWNTVRLVLWFVGSIAVAAGTFPVHARVSRPLALIGSGAVVVTTGAWLAWLLLAQGRPSPFGGAFGLAGFWITTAATVGTVVFGLIATRLGVVWRPASIALAIGTALGYLGVGQLRLTSADAPTIYGTLAMAGLAVAALAWIALGLELALPRRGAPGVRPVATQTRDA